MLKGPVYEINIGEQPPRCCVRFIVSQLDRMQRSFSVSGGRAVVHGCWGQSVLPASSAVKQILASDFFRNFSPSFPLYPSEHNGRKAANNELP